MARLILFLVLLHTSVAQANPTYQMPLYEALHKAGYQSMLTQRIAKCYLSITLGLDVQRHRTYLEGSVRVFEQNHQRLLDHAPTAEIRSQLQEVSRLWKAYKAHYHETYTLEHAAEVLEFSNKILLQCNTALLLLEHYAARYEDAAEQHHLSSMIDYSEQQCMLSQRAVLYTLATCYNIGYQVINKKRLTQTLHDFGAYQQKMQNYPENNTAIQEQLGILSKNWRQLQQLITVMQPSGEKRDQEHLLLAALDRSDRLLFASDELAFLYERLQAIPESTALN